jgi:hypothetical protein
VRQRKTGGEFFIFSSFPQSIEGGAMRGTTAEEIDRKRRDDTRWLLWWLRTVGYWGATGLNLVAVLICAGRGFPELAAVGGVLTLLAGSACCGLARLIEIQAEALELLSTRPGAPASGAASKSR